MWIEKRPILNGKRRAASAAAATSARACPMASGVTSAIRKGSPTEATTGSWRDVSTAAASRPTHRATTAAGTRWSRVSGWGAVRVAPITRASASRIRSTGTRPAASSKRRVGPSVRPLRSASRARVKAVPTFGCPANGISFCRVKIRTRAVWAGSSGGSTKVDSE